LRQIVGDREPQRLVDDKCVRVRADAGIILEVPPPRDSRFGSPLVLNRVHWVRPELVAEVKYLTCTEDNLLRQVVYEGLRDDKPATEVRRDVPHPKPATAPKVLGRP
jgi:bifunctional non-homologous end joining protein LigD